MSRSILRFDVHGDPKAQPRPRATVGRDGKARVYDQLRVKRGTGVDARTVVAPWVEWKDQVRETIEARLDELGIRTAPGDVAFGVTLEFRMRRPKAHFRTGRFAEQLKPGFVEARHTQVPDLDNLVKLVLDAVGAWRGLPRLVWADDSQICEVGGATKRWAKPGEEPGLTMWVERDPARSNRNRGRIDDLESFDSPFGVMRSFDREPLSASRAER